MVLHYPMSRYVITVGVIGMAGSMIGIGMVMRAQYRVMEKPYCVKALEYLHQNERAIELIGKPIKLIRPDVTDKAQIFGATITDINIPFKGTNKSGLLHIVADREFSKPNTDIEDLTQYDKDKKEEPVDWSIRKLEIKFDDMPNKLLVVYKRPQ